MIASCLLSGCKKESKKGGEDSTSAILQFEKNMMEQYYYWASTMRVPSTTNGYDPESYFDAMLVEKDVWSWMCEGEEFAEMETGISTSYGLHLGQPIEYYDDYSIYVQYVSKDSPVGKAGIKRGYQLIKINNIDVNQLLKDDKFYYELEKFSNTFTFKDLTGTEKDYNLTQSQYKEKSVVATAVYNNENFPLLPNGKKVGYINYITFNDNLKEDIITTLSSFKEQNINELILDLRYNNGGDLDLCQEIASLLAPQSADGKTFIQITHNNKISSKDFKFNFQRKSSSLDLDRLIVITGKYTASASESIINGLSTHMDVITIGETTYGKPNGMYVFVYPQNANVLEEVKWAFLPICFYCMNSEGNADFEDGISPIYHRFDDLYHDFGTDEDLIKSALNYIATGNVGVLPEKRDKTSNIGLTTTNKVIKTRKDTFNYGLGYIKKKDL